MSFCPSYHQSSADDREIKRDFVFWVFEFITNELKFFFFFKYIQTWNCLNTPRKLLPMTALVMQYCSSCLECVFIYFVGKPVFQEWLPDRGGISLTPAVSQKSFDGTTMQVAKLGHSEKRLWSFRQHILIDNSH